MTLINFLKEALNFSNSEFIIKKKIGKNTFRTTHHFKLIEETENEIIIPRGFIGTLIRFCRDKGIDYEFLDIRKKKDKVIFSFNALLREHQKSAVEATIKKEIGVRQSFLKVTPDNFSKIIHDYTEERKGFVLWKDTLEQLLS